MCPPHSGRSPANKRTHGWNYHLISLESMSTVVEGKALIQSTLLVRFWLGTVHRGPFGLGVYILIRKMSR